MTLKHTCVATVLTAVLSGPSFAAQTIVLMRHGEKPAEGLGQLNCQGLQRALALPKVLIGKFGRPAALYAPNPGVMKDDRGRPYNYVRPLATIEPTAIALGMPVNASFGFDDVAGVTAALLRPDYKNATVFVAWEHRVAEELARALLKAKGADASTVPRWDGDDFDSLYVVTIGDDGSARFSLQHEGLNGQSATCP